MNTYHKFLPNVFLAKCTEQHKRGDIIPVTTKHGKENDSIVFNLIFERDGFFYYSIIRADGFDVQEWAKRRAEKLETAASNAEKKGEKYYKASKTHDDFLRLAEPIKIGHHSEKQHRKIIENAQRNFGKYVERSDKATEYMERAAYWESRTNDINLSIPESIDFYEFKYEEAIERHKGLKDGSIQRDHSFSLTYAKKAVNDLKAKVSFARRLWGEPVIK